MKIVVKIVFGEERFMEVTDTMSVLELKALVNNECAIPVASQKLLLKGRALLDGKVLSEYDIKEGTKITVFVAHPRVAASVSPAVPATQSSLYTVLFEKLKLFYDDSHARLLTDAFMRDFYIRVGNLSLDDLERLATEYLAEDMANHSLTDYPYELPVEISDDDDEVPKYIVQRPPENWDC